MVLFSRMYLAPDTIGGMCSDLFPPSAARVASTTTSLLVRVQTVGSGGAPAATSSKLSQNAARHARCPSKPASRTLPASAIAVPPAPDAASPAVVPPAPVPEAPVPAPPAPIVLVDVDDVVMPVDVARPVDVSTVLLPPAAASGVADPVGADSLSLQARAAAIDSAAPTIRQPSSLRKKPPVPSLPTGHRWVEAAPTQHSTLSGRSVRGRARSIAARLLFPFEDPETGGECEGYFAQRPAVQTPEQQSEPIRHRTPVSWQRRSQKPPEQNCEQHWLSFWQLVPVAPQERPGVPHRARVPVQANPQHSPPIVHA